MRIICNAKCLRNTGVLQRSGGLAEVGDSEESPSQCSAILLLLLACLAIGLCGLNNIWEFWFGQGGPEPSLAPIGLRPCPGWRRRATGATRTSTRQQATPSASFRLLCLRGQLWHRGNMAAHFLAAAGANRIRLDRGGTGVGTRPGAYGQSTDSFVPIWQLYLSCAAVRSLDDAGTWGGAQCAKRQGRV
jgi:hypothetical protein